MIHSVLLQKSPKTGEFIDVNVYNAWYGFEKRGIATGFFTWPQMLANELEISRDTLVVGGIQPVRRALEQLGRKTPNNMDYPDSLAYHLHRDVYQTDLRTVFKLCKDDKIDPPVFVKPVTGHKEFDGRVLSRYRDLIPLASFLEINPQVWVSELVDFLSEYRYFVRRGNLVGVGHYRGSTLLHPDATTIEGMLHEYEDAPAAYTLDVGVLLDGTTALVEVNDGFAFGVYGLNALQHTKMLEDRWCELVDYPLPLNW